MDDIRPPQRGSRPPGHGRPEDSNLELSKPNGNLGDADEPTFSGPQHSSYQLPETKNKKGKGKTIALILFIILFVGSASAAAWLYLEQQKSQEDIDELNSEVQRLTNDIYQLRYDSRDAEQKMQLFTTDFNSLVDTANELKTTCADACSGIVVPEKR